MEFGSIITLGFRSRTLPGCIELVVVVLFGVSFIAFLDSKYNGDSFTCEPETSSLAKQLCYDEYSSAMNPWFTPLYFVVFAFCVLFILSIAFMLYGALTLRKLKLDQDEKRKENKHDVKLAIQPLLSSEMPPSSGKERKEKNPDCFWRVYLLHVGFRVIFILVMIGIFCGKQTLLIPKTYKCSVPAVATQTPLNETETELHCHDQHYKEKSISNIFIIIIKVFIMILCMSEFIQVILTPADKLPEKLLGSVLEPEPEPDPKSGEDKSDDPKPEEPDKPDDIHLVVVKRESKVCSRRSPNSVPRGKELWDALKRDPVDKKRVNSLLEACVPVDFREPGSQQTRRTPLHFVVSEINGDDGDELMVMLLAHGAKINLADRYDLTPLHLAAEKGNLHAVKRLVINNADRNKRNRKNETPAEVAKKKGKDDVFNWLTSFQPEQERK